MINSDFDIKFYEEAYGLNSNNLLKSYLDFDKIYHPPYEKYQKILIEKISKNSEVLDLCVGDGIHSILPAKISKYYTALEPTKSGLNILKQKFKDEGIINYTLINSKIENFYSENIFDLITIINSTSYFEKNELKRIYNTNLKKGGYLILIDSLRTNPIYRFNHLINALMGKRSFHAINRIFTYSNLKLYLDGFKKSSIETYYFGPFLFLATIFKKLGLNSFSFYISNYPKKGSIFDRFSFKFLTIITK